MPMHVLAVLNRPSMDAAAHDPDAPPFSLRDPSVPNLSALDLAATRGDGVFETVSVGHGRAQALDHHLSRFVRSAAMLDLPAPDVDAWRSTIVAVIRELAPTAEAWVKTVLTRGIEGGDRPTGWAYAAYSPDYRPARTDGVRVVLLDRGYRSDVAETSPWLLAGAKTLSYAVNRAASREAASREADDVVFVSSDGVLLEGPTATLVYRRGNTLITPPLETGILDGTTRASLFRYAGQTGMTTAFERGTPATLLRADAAWLVSSVRLAAPIRAIDNRPMAVDVDLSARMNEYLGGLTD